jgi:hypothetical protein
MAEPYELAGSGSRCLVVACMHTAAASGASELLPLHRDGMAHRYAARRQRRAWLIGRLHGRGGDSEAGRLRGGTEGGEQSVMVVLVASHCHYPSPCPSHPPSPLPCHVVGCACGDPQPQNPAPARVQTHSSRLAAPSSASSRCLHGHPTAQLHWSIASPLPLLLLPGRDGASAWRASAAQRTANRREKAKRRATQPADRIRSRATRRPIDLRQVGEPSMPTLHASGCDRQAAMTRLQRGADAERQRRIRRARSPPRLLPWTLASMPVLACAAGVSSS